MKYIALAIYHSPKGRIPLFLELRALNSLTSKNFLQLIHSQYKGQSSVNFSDFMQALEKGYFILILDGFDEIAPSDRANIERQIIDLAVATDDCPIIVSGRPDDRFYSWERFKVRHLKAMNYDQARSLIEVSDYDDDVKKVFLKRLTPEFFKKHESFLSTPLLAIMLMITFEEYAEIPISLHEFYRNAFDTLVRRHDALKYQFLRPTHSGYTAEEFKKLFSGFCILTYSKSAFSFDRSQAIDFLESSIKQQQIKINVHNILQDLIESICLLQEEGFEISFVHRSFQEYFCAVFISSAPSGFVSKYLDSGRFRTFDDVLPMLYGMVPDRVEAEWALEAVSNILSLYSKDDADYNWKFYLDLYPTIEVTFRKQKIGPILLTDSDLSRKLDILKRLYPIAFSEAHNGYHGRRSKKEQQAWQSSLYNSLSNLEKYGEPQLRGFDDAWATENGEFMVELTPDFKDVICALYGCDEGVPEIAALLSIQKQQKVRTKGGDKFLKELFSSSTSNIRISSNMP